MTPAEEPLGSAAQEATRLINSLREWLDARGVPEQPPLATGSAECRACPFCLLLGAVREHHPEVVEQLGRASESLLAALRSLVSDHEHRWAQSDESSVERIDVE